MSSHPFLNHRGPKLAFSALAGAALGLGIAALALLGIGALGYTALVLRSPYLESEMVSSDICDFVEAYTNTGGDCPTYQQVEDYAFGGVIEDHVSDSGEYPPAPAIAMLREHYSLFNEIPGNPALGYNDAAGSCSVRYLRGFDWRYVCNIEIPN